MINLTLLFVVLIGINITKSLVRDQSNLVESRQFFADNKQWYDVFNGQHIVLSFTISEGFDSLQTTYIREQFQTLKSKTCLKIFEYAANDEQCNDLVACIRFIRMDEPSSCHANRRTREIFLPQHCFYQNLVLHEILHVLGMGHEHQRSDRDCYVEVNPPWLKDPEYSKLTVLDISFPYDVHSVMHYRRGDALQPAAFAWDQAQEFGSHDELTEMDVIALNYMFCGGRHYCEINPKRCQDFRCWIECNPCSDEPISQCRNCTGNTY